MPMASAHMRRLSLAGGDTAADLQPLQYPALIQLRPAATALAQVDQLFLQCRRQTTAERGDAQPVGAAKAGRAPAGGEDEQQRADPRHAGRVALRTQGRHLPAENVLVVQEGGDGEAVGRCSPSFT